jgi:hypothetical protein
MATITDRDITRQIANLANAGQLDTNQLIAIVNQAPGVNLQSGTGLTTGIYKEFGPFDRVDAKVNDGEAILNIPQQQRLMDFIRGELDLTELGDEDIVEGVPRDYRDSLHDKIEDGSEGKSSRSKGLKTLLDALGE